MSTTTLGLRGQANPEERVAAKSVRLAALLATLMLVSIAVNGLIAIADTTLRQQSMEIARQSAERLAGYGEPASQLARQRFL